MWAVVTQNKQNYTPMCDWARAARAVGEAERSLSCSSWLRNLCARSGKPALSANCDAGNRDEAQMFDVGSTRKGVLQLTSAAFLLCLSCVHLSPANAPAFNKRSTASEQPDSAASIRGVRPFLSTMGFEHSPHTNLRQRLQPPHAVRVKPRTPTSAPGERCGG